MLRVRIKTNKTAYSKDTLTIAWQVSDDGIRFTDIEGVGGAMNAVLMSTYIPTLTPGQTKYYRAVITNKGLEEGMTPTSTTSAIAKIAYMEGSRPGLEIEQPMLRQADGALVSDDALSKVTLYGSGGSLPKSSQILAHLWEKSHSCMILHGIRMPISSVAGRSVIRSLPEPLRWMLL